MDERGLPRIEFDNIQVGDEFGPVEYVITQDNIDNFRKAVGNPNARYPTVAKRHAATLLETRYAYGGGINAGHECEDYNPPIPGKKIIVTGKVVDKYIKRDKPYLIFEAKAVDEDGRLIEIIRLTRMNDPREVTKKWQ